MPKKRVLLITLLYVPSALFLFFIISETFTMLSRREVFSEEVSSTFGLLVVILFIVFGVDYWKKSKVK